QARRASSGCRRPAGGTPAPGISVHAKGAHSGRRLRGASAGRAHDRDRQPPLVPRGPRRRHRLRADEGVARCGAVRRVADRAAPQDRSEARTGDAVAAAHRRGALLPGARAVPVTAKSSAVSWLTVALTSAVCVGIVLLSAVGYRATVQWQRSSALLVERQQD